MEETQTLDPSIRIPEAILQSGSQAWIDNYREAVTKQRAAKATKAGANAVKPSAQAPAKKKDS